jgi:hypothetical protein
MNNPAFSDQIITKLRTTAEVSQVIHALEEFSTTAFGPTNVPLQQQIFQKLPKEIADMLIKNLATQATTPETKIVIKRQVNELLDKLRTCKSIKLTIAFQPDDATISLFSDWIKTNTNESALIDLQFDKSIVGGAQIIVGGMYKDYSVRKNLINRFQIQKDEITKLLT